MLIVVPLLFGGVWATASAADSALPGDALYPFKTIVEEAQVAVSRDALRDAELHIRFAEDRLVEIDALIEARRLEDIPQATAQAEFRIQQAIDSLGLVAAGDPVQVQILTRQIAEILTRYNQVLTALLLLVPDDIRSDIQNGLQFTDQVSNENDDDNGNENGNENDDNNGNENDDDNGNENGNENDDDDENENDDDENENDDDDENENDDDDENDD